MSRASSAYVSPNLGPTAPWGQQTSTGVFRPPPAMSLNSSTADVARQENKSALPNVLSSNNDPERSMPASTSYSTSHQMTASPGFVARQGETGYAAPSPPLQPTSPPFYPQSAHYGGYLGSSFSLPPNGTNSYPSHAGGGAAVHTGDPIGGPVSAERILKMISYCVHKEEDIFLAQKEGNRVLERELQNEQELRRETQRKLDCIEESLQVLYNIRDGQAHLAEQLDISLTSTS